MFSKQNPPNCYSKLAFRRGPPVTIAFRGIKYTFFWQGSPDKLHITWAKWGRLNQLTWKTTRGNRAKVAQLRGKTTDLATLSRVDLFWGIGCDSTTWASYQETKSGPSVWDLAVDRLDVVGVVGDEHLLHDGPLAQAATADLHEHLEAAAGDLDSSRPMAVRLLCLLVNRLNRLIEVTCLNQSQRF